MSETTVMKLLVTGDAESLQTFGMRLTMVANFFETRRNGRGLTAHFALGSEYLDAAAQQAAQFDLTLEAIDGGGAGESYRVIHQGSLPGWGARPSAEPNQALLAGEAMVEHLDEPAGCYCCGFECHDGPCREGEADDDDDLADPDVPEDDPALDE